jgi:hypothetical protein
MDQIYPNVGLVEQLTRILTSGVHYHLFVNNVIPDRTSTLIGTPLTEAAWFGYVPIAKALGDFSITGVAGGVGFAIGMPFPFVNSSGGNQTAYGYFVTDVTNAILLAVARFDDAPETKVNGDSWIILPRWGDTSVLP